MRYRKRGAFSLGARHDRRPQIGGNYRGLRRALGRTGDRKYVDQPEFRVTVEARKGLVYPDHIAGKRVSRQLDADQVPELLGTGTASGLVVMSVERERDGEVPSEPDTAQQRSDSVPRRKYAPR